MADQFASQAMPGPSAVSITSEKAPYLYKEGWSILKGVVVKSTASDAGNTPTTELRAGLLLGAVTADGLFEHYQPTVATGPQVAIGSLWEARSMIGSDGTAVNRPA